MYLYQLLSIARVEIFNNLNQNFHWKTIVPSLGRKETCGPQESGHVCVDEWFPKSKEIHSSTLILTCLWTSRPVLIKGLRLRHAMLSFSHSIEWNLVQ